MTLATLRRLSQVFSTRPSGISRALRQLTPRILAASEASLARSSAVPRVPISPWVRSRMPVRCPRCAIFSSVPPQVCSTSSRCAAMARISREVADMSVQIALFEHDILAHDQSMRRHFFQRRQDAVHVIVSVHKGDDYGQLAASLDHVGGLDAMTSEKTGYCMQRSSGIHVLFAQVAQNLHVQGPVVPLVSFIQLDCDLHCHGVRHFTALAPRTCRPKPRPGTVNYC